MCLAFAVSLRSPNIRWLIGTLILIKTVDIISYETILHWGSGYYFIISTFDIAGITLIAFRQCTAGAIARLSIPFLSQFAMSSKEKYKLTANEVAIIGILSLSLLVNIASLIERFIRHHSDLNPMVIYDLFPMLKFSLSVLMLLVLCSVAINGARNIYRDIT